MAARNFTAESSERVDAAERCPSVAFEKDFLRWMLSDGAGAALLDQQPRADGLSLRIDWIDGVSLANELPVCMYSGAIKLPDGRLRGWREASDPLDMVREQYLTVKQDARLLDSAITSLVASGTLRSVLARRSLALAHVDWFVPHVSSLYFIRKLVDTLAQENFAIARERWFINLPQVGNVGSASIYLALEELLHSGRLERGQRVLCFVPESARFAVYYMLLTVT
jgi:3-oxoacyl-[acyl-carrier-protein] synthase-3